MPRSRRARVAVASLLALGAVTRRAPAGNDEGHLLGNQAAMTGGAVTATVSEGSAIWYNPAGLASVPSQSLDLSASAYGFRIQSAPRLLSSADGEAESVRITEFVSVPTAVAYVRPVAAGLSCGFGLFVPRESDLILRGELSRGTERWLLALAEHERVTYGGAALGWAVTDDFRFGLSVLNYLGLAEEEAQFSGGTPGLASASFISTSHLTTRTTVGGMVALGIQWDAAASWKVGFSLRSPELNYFSAEKDSSVTTASGAAGSAQFTAYVPVVTRTENHSSTLTRPIQLRLGLARVWPRGWLALDGDVSPELHQASTPQRAKVNLRLGGMHALADKISVGAGVFTDRDSSGGETPAGGLNFYGGSLGVSWGSTYRVEGDAKVDQFDFRTTLAVRYAYARSDVAALQVPEVDQLGSASLASRTRLTVHELTVHIGSGFYF